MLHPASMIQVGDLLAGPNHHLPCRVESIRVVTRKGVYAPFTNTGDIIVNGIAASNYIALPDAFQSTLSYTHQHLIQHAAYIPYRFYSVWIGCEDEIYDTASGLSVFVTMWLPLLQWMETKCPAVILRMILQVLVVLQDTVWSVKGAIVSSLAMTTGYRLWKQKQ